MWIDAHHHLWDPSVRPQTWMDQSWPINRPFDTGDLRAAIEGTPVEATIVVQTEPIIDETLEMPPIGSDLTNWTRSIRTLAGFEHVACKLSGLVTEADWAAWTPTDLTLVSDVVLECFGPDRTMFGSDWPVCLLAATYHGVTDSADAMTTGLSDHERSRLFEGTAREWYSLT